MIEGTDDRRTAFQFDGSGVVYLVGTIASATYFLLFVAGTWIAWKRGYALWLPLALILYLPATISFVLTNMRYTITVQPLLLIFAGVAVEAALRRQSIPIAAGGMRAFDACVRRRTGDDCRRVADRARTIRIRRRLHGKGAGATRIDVRLPVFDEDDAAAAVRSTPYC